MTGPAECHEADPVVVGAGGLTAADLEFAGVHMKAGDRVLVSTNLEYHELRTAVRRFLVERSSEDEVRRLMKTTTGHDPAVWRVLAGQLGLTGLLVPEEHGGAGFGFVELQIVCEEMGRALYCGPFLSSAVLTTAVLRYCGDAAAAGRYLPGLAEGSVVGALAFTEESGSWSPDDVRTTAVRTDTWRLTGRKVFVLDGVLADLLLVLARTERGPSLFAVAADAPGLHREPMTTLDATRKQARIDLDGTPGTLVGADGGAAGPVERALDLGAAALAAEQAGGARRVLEMAVEYAEVREQFGRPVGSYQAIKHKCADMLLEVEAATSAAYAAGWVAAENSDQTGVLARFAKAYCSEAYTRFAVENLQVHGGIGFTWEHPAQLYFKRAKSGETLLGSPRHHRELMVRRLGARAGG